MAYILIVDDSPHNRNYLERIIRLKTKHTMVFAETGPAAVEKMVEKRPDVIFLDLFIPGDGFVLFDNLRKHPATGSIPIIIHTAVPFDTVTNMRLRKMRHDGLVEFPVEASALVGRIDIALKRNSSVERPWVPPRA